MYLHAYLGKNIVVISKKLKAYETKPCDYYIIFAFASFTNVKKLLLKIVLKNTENSKLPNQ